MRMLVDSDVMNDVMAGMRRSLDWFTARTADDLMVSVISVAEVYEGAYGSRDPEDRLEEMRLFLQGFAIIPLTDIVLERFAEQRARLRRQGLLLPDMDLFIAASALAYDLPLVTRNVRHFARIPSLQMIQP